MTDIEQAARAEAERRYPATYRYDGDVLPNRGYSEAREAFERCASWLAEYLLSDENVDVMALALARFVSHAPLIVLVDGPNRDYFRAEASAALEAVLGKGE